MVIAFIKTLECSLREYDTKFRGNCILSKSIYFFAFICLSMYVCRFLSISIAKWQPCHYDVYYVQYYELVIYISRKSTNKEKFSSVFNQTVM